LKKISGLLLHLLPVLTFFFIEYKKTILSLALLLIQLKAMQYLYKRQPSSGTSLAAFLTPQPKKVAGRRNQGITVGRKTKENSISCVTLLSNP
jgi:hypothetical protein